LIALENDSRVAKPTNILNSQIDNESVFVIALAGYLMTEDVLAGVAADDYAENDISALACSFHLCIVGVRQVGPMLEALLGHVKVVKADDRDFVVTTDMCTTLLAQSAAFDAFFTPAPIGPVCYAVELYISSRWLFRRRCDFQRLSLLSFIFDLDELRVAASLNITVRIDNLFVRWSYELPLRCCSPVGARIC